FGGIYGDIDTECRQSLEPLVSEDRAIFCYEPFAHWEWTITHRGLPVLLFNGVMASPAGHPFWLHLLELMRDVSEASDVLDSTGPCLLTAAALSFPAPESVRIDPAVLFNPVDVYGHSDFPSDHPDCYTVHHWAGTWYELEGRESWIKRKRKRAAKRFYRAKAKLTGGPRLNEENARAAVSADALAAELPAGDNIAILVPVRDGSSHIPGFLAAIERLEIPAERLKLVFCEGDSSDGSYECLVRLTEPLKHRYREIKILRKDIGIQFDHARRWQPAIQRERRAGLAMIRNFLIDEGLNESDDWALWIDIDVWCFPTDIVEKLLSARARIVVPNCVTKPGGCSFDLNSFASREVVRDYRYYRMVKNGIYQPPLDKSNRLRLSDLRHSDQVPLVGVGGTMLLVDAVLHRGGLRFPELPYDHLIETEGFGRLANHCGITPIGLPRVEILHVPW
ncbi:MAG: glycosyl transferase, partial [Verrucomicrobiales bacterium]